MVGDSGVWPGGTYLARLAAACGRKATSWGATCNWRPEGVVGTTRDATAPGSVEGTVVVPKAPASRRWGSTTVRSHDPRLAVATRQPSWLAAITSGNGPTGSMLKPGWLRSRS